MSGPARGMAFRNLKEELAECKAKIKKLKHAIILYDDVLKNVDNSFAMFERVGRVRRELKDLVKKAHNA